MVDVRNTGARAGDEVVQMYIHDEVSTATRPLKELRGFQRVTLAPGETRTIVFEIRGDLLAYHDTNMKRVVEAGEFQIMVGGSSVDLQSIALTIDSPRAGSPGSRPPESPKTGPPFRAPTP
jgi:beta-glucosidase